MLRIEVDMYSGRPNPSWTVDEKDAKDILDKIAKSPQAVVDAEAESQGLGYRGIIIEPLAEELMYEYDMPASFMIAGSGSKDIAGGIDLAAEIVKRMPVGKKAANADATPLDANLKETILNEINVFSKRMAIFSERDGVGEAAAPVDVTCYYEKCSFNPVFWNHSEHISRNNCYNYAINRRTDTFAQPGKACGHQAFTMACDVVANAALCDGAHRRYDCFPDSEKNRYLVALVVWPGEDYHWYRLHSNGFWGHKPGRTAARNTDNCNRVIINPQTCCRGPYTQFCGYFYTCKSMRIR